MIALLQRVSRAIVEVDGGIVGRIERGLLVFLCAERDDTRADSDKLLTRLLSFRIFPDQDGKMNRSITDVGGGMLLIPQFTLAADTQSGTRPSFTPAASPAKGRELFDYFVDQASARHPLVATGRFGADMQVSLTNDGPVTFWLQVPHARPQSAGERAQ